jgi:hypothetical protein
VPLALQNKALGHAEVGGGDGVGRRLGGPSVPVSQRFGSRAMFTALANKGRQHAPRDGNCVHPVGHDGWDLDRRWACEQFGKPRAI